MSGIRSLHIIVAAGSGSRFGADLPKQFCLMAGRPVIVHTIEAMRRASGPDDRIVVAISAPMIPVWEKIEVAYGPTGAAMIAAGGPTRAATVANALRATARMEADVITIHDGARPLITPAVVDRLVEAASRPAAAALSPWWSSPTRYAGFSPGEAPKLLRAPATVLFRLLRHFQPGCCVWPMMQPIHLTPCSPTTHRL